MPQLIPEEGEEMVWEGFKSEAGLCGNNVVCAGPACVSEGTYTARYCAYPVQHDAGSVDAGLGECEHAATTPLCVEQPFEYPATTFVEMVLEP